MGQVFPGRRGYNINNAYGHDGLKHSKIQGSYKANARELRTQQEARDRELDARRQLDDAYARETERERRTFDDAHQEAYAQFRDCMQQGRSDLEECCTLCEQAAALKAELQILPAAAAAATVPPADPNTATPADVPGLTSAAQCSPNFYCSFCLCTATYLTRTDRS